MIASERPDRIHAAFDDHRLVSNAGLLLPVTLAGRLGLSELTDSHLDLGDAPGRANAGDQDSDPCGVGSGRRRLHRRRGRAAFRQHRAGAGLYGEGAVHPGDLPAQLPVGVMCASWTE